jgi:hypothetical protein
MGDTANEARGMAAALVSRADFRRAELGTVIAAALTLSGVGFAFLAASPILRALLGSLCASTSISCAVCWYRLRRRGATLAGDELVMGLALSACVVLAAGAIGPSSAAVAFMVPLVYTFGLNRSEALSRSVYGLCAMGYLAVAILIPEEIAFGFAALVEAVLLASWLHARRNRRALLESLHAMAEMKCELERRSTELERAREEARLCVTPPGVGSLTGQALGAYRVGELLGRGGMGEVYRAWKRGAAQPVAIKVIPRAQMHDAVNVERFFREAKLAGRLDSPHLVRVHEVGFSDAGAPYFVMDLLRGCNLGQLLDRRGRLSLGETVELVAQVRGARERPSRRHRAPRHQARERVPHHRGRALVLEGARLRHLQGERLERHAHARLAGRHARLHVARAGALDRRRSPHRSLRARRARLPRADGRAGLRRARSRRHAVAGAQ